MPLLYIDTESNPITKKPECITWLFEGKKGIIEKFNDDSYYFLKEKWNKAEAIILFNAPYDLGVLSICYPQNSYYWLIRKIFQEKASCWKINLFDNIYDVRKISFFRNLIKNRNRKKLTKSHKEKGILSTPVIDLLKLWSILINENDIGLKSLIKKEFNKTVIPYSEINAKTEEYRYQDVIYLEKLFKRFFEKIKPIAEVKDFTYQEWSFIKTPATFTKILYERCYPDLKIWSKNYNQLINDMGMKNPLESAFHGGITLSFYRGTLKKFGWIDIKGAYSKAIKVLNTDSYLNSGIVKVDNNQLNFNNPFLCYANVNFIMKSINKSLKLFYIKEKSKVWIWNFDIIACQNLIPDFEYEIIKVFKFVPLNKVEKSLPEAWNYQKETEKKESGKTTLYNFYKYLSNTSYGIKAQRKPFITIHTNMIIAGMITAKVHEILSKMIKIIRDNKYKNIYNDTDSVGFLFKHLFNPSVIEKINIYVAPFNVEFEGIFEKTTILSLKRYVSIHKNPKNNKVKLHGKGRYKINESDIMDFVDKKKVKKDGYLNLIQLAGNTEISMTMIENIYKEYYPQYLNELLKYRHPFMFIKNVKTDVLKSEFMRKWYYHIDTKTTFKKKGEFQRNYHKFDCIKSAIEYFKNFSDIPDEKGDDINCDFRNFDKEIYEDFKIIPTGSKTQYEPKNEKGVGIVSKNK